MKPITTKTTTKSMTLTAAAGLASVLASAAHADIFTNAAGLGVEPVITFEDRDSGPVDGTEWRDETGIVFDTLLLYITDFFTNPGGEGNLLAGDMGTTSLNITFDEAQTAFAMAWATNPGSSTVTAFLGDEVVEVATVATQFLDADNAFLVVEGITFDRIKIEIDARIFDFSLDNVQLGGDGIGSGCPADFDGDGELTLFDFLAFQSAFATGC